MTSLVPLFETISRMSLAEKELVAWFAGNEFAKGKQDKSDVEGYIKKELEMFPVTDELRSEIASVKRLGRPSQFYTQGSIAFLIKPSN